MAGSVVFVHGAWVTPACWDSFRKPFEDAGYQVHAPTWPMLEGLSVEELRRNTPRGFGSLTVGRIADHLEAYIRALPTTPILIGHSFGGLLVQMLLDRGVGSAGVAINPAPIGGVIVGPTSLSSALPVLTRWNGWNRPFAHTRQSFGRYFANTAPPELVSEIFDTVVIPAPGRIFYQAATWLGTDVNARSRTQPLLITSASEDRLVSPYVSRAAYNIQRKSPAWTEIKHYPGLSHLLISEPGWERVADDVLNWVRTI